MNLEDVRKRLEKLRKQEQELKEEHQRSIVRKEAMLETLKDEFGVSSLEEANVLKDKLNEELRESKEQLNDLLILIEKKVAEYGQTRDIKG
jgi:adenylyl- and sulfurtransferase ThiI